MPMGIPSSFVLVVLLLVLACTGHAWTPEQCPQDCVRPLSFWIQHRPDTGSFWPGSSETKTFKCGPTWLEVITTTATTDPWTLLAKQYIAAQLNILSFSCIDTLPPNTTQAITEALTLLSDDNCTVSDETLAAYVRAVITQFNNGNGAVATCLCPFCPGSGGSNPSTQCPTCPTCPTQSPFTCTPSVIDQCCQQPTTAPPPPPTTTTQIIPTTTPPPSCGPCTRTQGYFKTHPEVWNDFTICGISALTILGTASAGGDAFIILARQFIAARLNVEVLGVCLDDTIVSGALAAAETLLVGACSGFGTYSAPAKDSDLRDEFIAISMILDNFNNGLLGPGHCNDGSDETSSRITPVYVKALESSYAMDDALFSSATAVMPAVFCMLVALLALIV